MADLPRLNASVHFEQDLGEIKRLREENARLRWANAGLRVAVDAALAGKGAECDQILAKAEADGDQLTGFVARIDSFEIQSGYDRTTSLRVQFVLPSDDAHVFPEIRRAFDSGMPSTFHLLPSFGGPRRTDVTIRRPTNFIVEGNVYGYHGLPRTLTEGGADQLLRDDLARTMAEAEEHIADGD